MSLILRLALNGFKSILKKSTTSKLTDYFIQYKIDLINDMYKADIFTNKINWLPDFSFENNNFNEDEQIKLAKEIIVFLNSNDFVDLRKVLLLGCFLMPESQNNILLIQKKSLEYLIQEIKKNPLKYLSSSLIASESNYENKIQDLIKCIFFTISFTKNIVNNDPYLPNPVQLLSYFENKPEIHQIDIKIFIDNFFLTFSNSFISLEAYFIYNEIYNYFANYPLDNIGTKLNLSITQIHDDSIFISNTVKALKDNLKIAHLIEKDIEQYTTNINNYIVIEDFIKLFKSYLRIYILSKKIVEYNEVEKIIESMFNEMNTKKWLPRIFSINTLFSLTKTDFDTFNKRLECSQKIN